MLKNLQGSYTQGRRLQGEITNTNGETEIVTFLSLNEAARKVDKHPRTI